MTSPLSQSPSGVILGVRAVPRASKTEFAGSIGDALKVRLRAPPVDGKANKALIAFVAQQLGVSARHVEILSGGTGRTKRLLIRGLTIGQVRSRLPEAAEKA